MGDSGYLPEEGEEEGSFALDKLGKEFSNQTMGDTGYLPEEGEEEGSFALDKLGKEFSNQQLTT
jgi:hypothetical protein